MWLDASASSHIAFLSLREFLVVECSDDFAHGGASVAVEP